MILQSLSQKPSVYGVAIYTSLALPHGYNAYSAWPFLIQTKLYIYLAFG